jgi:uncharacterized protein YdiU (UPF0061 family)
MASRTIPAKRTTQRSKKPLFFGPPPLIAGEDPAAYDDLLERFTAAIKPTDVLEEIWMRDSVDLTWETQRLRHLKAALLKWIMLEKLSFILEPVELESSDEAESSDEEPSAEELEAESSDEEPSADELEDESSDYELSTDELAERWAARDPQAIEEVNEQLASKGLTVEDVTARALSAEIENFERIDRMVMNAEARRNAALRELERHRMTLAQALRQASDDVVDADFEDVAPVRRRLRDKA